MPPKPEKKYNQIAFALEILKLLAEQPRKRDELANLLAGFLDTKGKTTDDVTQKVTRAIRKLRDCGIEIESGTHSPYKLIESNFPVLLSTEQRESLATAAYYLSDMGFSAQARQIQRIGNLTESDIPSFVKVDFSPPVDYSDRNLNVIVRQLEERFVQQCRYTIRYQSKPGAEGQIKDIDRSELRLHDGLLYLFAFIPDWRSWRFDYWHNIDQNHIFRLDRILSVGAASDTPWVSCDFPTLKVRYRTSGQLANYKPRRKDEVVIYSDPEGKFREIEATIDYWFWFRQRILKYGANAKIISPQTLADEIKKEYKKIWEQYSLEENSEKSTDSRTDSKI